MEKARVPGKPTPEDLSLNWIRNELSRAASRHLTQTSDIFLRWCLEQNQQIFMEVSGSAIFQFKPQMLVTGHTEKPTVMFHQPPTLLTLPVELRLPIYRILLNKYNPHNTKTFLNISLVCHQIRDEILPLIFHDSIYFHSPEKLSKWTSRGDPCMLKLVDNISLHVFEEALVKLRKSLAESKEDPTEDFQSTKDWLTIRKPSQVEIFAFNSVGLAPFCRTMWSGSSKIIRANIRSFHQPKDTVGEKDAVTAAWDFFRAISNIRKIWILFRSSNTGSDRNSNLLEKEQQLVLNMIPAACPKMQEFTFRFRTSFPSLFSLIFKTFDSCASPAIRSQVPKRLCRF